MRLAIILGVVVILAVALLYTSLNASTEAKIPSQLLHSGSSGERVELTGKVVDGSVKKSGGSLQFEIRDRKGTAAVPVRYSGQVPDPFREGREVLVKGVYRNGAFVAERDSLVTKCPSKFTKKESA